MIPRMGFNVLLAFNAWPRLVSHLEASNHNAHDDVYHSGVIHRNKVRSLGILYSLVIQHLSQHLVLATRSRGFLSWW